MMACCPWQPKHCANDDHCAVDHDNQNTAPKDVHCANVDQGRQNTVPMMTTVPVLTMTTKHCANDVHCANVVHGH